MLSLPLFHLYPGMSQPQPAYLYLTPQGELSAGWDPNIGSGMSSDLWHMRLLRFPISPYLREDDIRDLLENEHIIQHAKDICEGWGVVRDDHNERGMLTEESENARLTLDRLCEQFSHDCDMDLFRNDEVEIVEAYDYLRRIASADLPDWSIDDIPEHIHVYGDIKSAKKQRLEEIDDAQEANI